MQLSGKRVLITGGGRGIGRAIAERLARDGASVVVTGRTRGEIDEVAAAVGGRAVVCDLMDRAATDRMVAAVRELGRVDVLVNNAGIAESAPLEGTDDAMWDRIVETNATAPFRLTRAFVPAMVSAGWGRVITVSPSTVSNPPPKRGVYTAAKAAHETLMLTLAAEYKEHGVTANIIQVYAIDVENTGKGTKPDIRPRT